MSHKDLRFDQPYTSFVDVLFDGVTHQILSAKDRSGVNFSNTTGSFTVNGFRGWIIESLDTVATQVVHRHTAVIESLSGVLSTSSYDGAGRLLDLFGAIAPAATPLGMTIGTRTDAEISGYPRIAMQTEIGLIEVSPLTSAVVDQLPTWAGTATAAGELFAGRHGDSGAYLVLVTDSCRVLVMLAPESDHDLAAETISALDVRWQL